MLTSHFVYYLLHIFILFLIQPTMDDVSPETCFVFIKKCEENYELQKHHVVHQSNILLHAATKPQ